MHMSTGPGTRPYTLRMGDSLRQIARRFHTTPQAILSVNPALRENGLRVGQTIFIPLGYAPPPESPSRPGCVGQAELALNNRMRLLWEQHVYWTQMTIVSLAHNLPDAEVVVARLLRNAKDFEAAFVPFYGEAIAGQFAQLLTSHIKIAGELVTAAKADDSAAADHARKQWYENADEIAAFLGSINPHWSAQEWRKMLYDHLAMIEAEVNAVLTGKSADSVRIFEAIEQEALMMADHMTQGIVKQFPQYFR